MKAKVLITLMGLILAPTAMAQNVGQEPLLDESDSVYECEDPNEPLDPNSSEARQLGRSDNLDEQGCAQFREQLFEQSDSPEVNPTPDEALLPDRRQEILNQIQLLQSLVDLLRQRLALLRGQ